MTDRLHRAPTDPAARRRSAPVAEDTSDVTRFAGVGIAALVLAAGVAGAIVATVQPAVERAPGPLSRPHVQAGLGCEACHGSQDAIGSTAVGEPASACVTCHPGHASTRAGHRAQ